VSHKFQAFELYGSIWA